MDFFQTAQNPWGQEVLIRISWDLLYLFTIGGALFILGHLLWRWKWAPKVAVSPSEQPAGGAAASIPEKVARHSLAARLFHWSMAATVLVLLFTGFLPVVGVKFDWVTIHWIAGLVFIGTIIFHVIDVARSMTLLDVWVGRRELKEWWQEVKHDLGLSAPPPRKPGKYPIAQRMFHHLAVITGLGVILTGTFMMWRVETPFFARNPYLFSDSTWGLVYVIHGLCSVMLVGMTMAHVYFAVLPEKRWLTVSMIAGWITKKNYLEHHDPERWVVKQASQS